MEKEIWCLCLSTTVVVTETWLNVTVSGSHQIESTNGPKPMDIKFNCIFCHGRSLFGSDSANLNLKLRLSCWNFKFQFLVSTRPNNNPYEWLWGHLASTIRVSTLRRHHAPTSLLICCILWMPDRSSHSVLWARQAGRIVEFVESLCEHFTALVVFYLYFLYPKFLSPLRLVRGPTSKRLQEQLKVFNGEFNADLFRQLVNEYGPIFRLAGGPLQGLVVSTSTGVQRVLVGNCTNYQIVRSQLITLPFPLILRDLVIAYARVTRLGNWRLLCSSREGT